MAFSINTNTAALSAHASMVSNDNKLSESLGRLSTGLRINKAADDASGMTIADSLRSQHLGIGQAVSNANDGISMVQTADGALEESINIVNTIKTKAIQAASDGQTTETRKAIQADIDKLMEELDVIAQTTSYNGQKLLSGVFTNKEIQIGAFSNETSSITIGSTESTNIGHITTAELSLGSDAGGEVQLTITSSVTGEELTLNTVDIQYNNEAESGIGELAGEINKYSSMTGISADAVVESTTNNAISAGATSSDFSINGITIGAVDVEDNDATGSLLSAINSKATEHGVTATMNSDGTMTLTSGDGRAIEVTGGVSDVMGTTASQMSTVGHINLTQEGTAQFQISGIGAGAAGADIDINQITTVEDSVLAAGSVIVSGSTMTAGTIIGGDVTTATNITATQLDFELVAGSTLASGSVIAEDTVLGGMATTAGDETVLQDMLVTSGSTLESGSILAAGTVITQDFTVGTVDYETGDVLTDNVTLDGDITLQGDMTLAKDSILESGSKLAAGTIARADIGISLNSTLSDDMTLEAGSTLALGSTLLADSELGDSVQNNGDVTSYGRTELSSGSTLATASVIAEGSTIGGSATISGDETLLNDMTITAGSTLESGSILAAGTVITQDFTVGTVDYEAGDVLTDNVTIDSDLALSTDMTLAEDSILESGSILAVNTSNAGTVGLSESENMRLSDINVLTSEGAQFAISIADAALADLDETRSGLGSTQNQLTSTIANLSTTKTNVMAAESSIRDVDFAEEASTYSSLSLLAQTSSYALAQANASTQNLMSLLQ